MNPRGSNWSVLSCRDGALQQQRAASVPHVLRAAGAPQADLTIHFLVLIQRLELLGS